MDKRSLVQKIRREFPQLAWQYAEHNVEGWDHYVLSLDNKYIFRFPRKEIYQKRLYGEVLFLRYLSERDLGIATPRYEFVAGDKSFAGYAILRGSQMKKAEVFDKLSGSAKHAIARQIASFLSALHKTPLRIAKKYQIKTLNGRKQYRDLVGNIKKYIYPRLPKRENALISEFLREFAKYQSYPKQCLIHGDLYASHLIVSEDRKRLSGVIDFSDRRIADPARDFAELWEFGDEFVKEVYQNYTGPKDKDFLHRSRLYYKRMPLYVMTSPFLGFRGSFALGHKLFREIFGGERGRETAEFIKNA